MTVIDQAGQYTHTVKEIMEYVDQEYGSLAASRLKENQQPIASTESLQWVQRA